MAYPQLRASITSSLTDSNASSVVCTHPTGLTAGDLMVLFVALFNAGADRTMTNPAGWTTQTTWDASSRRTLTAFKKIATAGDVSAGSTTVTFSGDVDKFGYAMFAITGAAPSLEISLSESDDIDTSAGTTTPTAISALTPVVSESLVISAFLATDLNLSAVLTASSFSLTPTTSLVERVDVGVRDGASDGCSLFIATGEYSGTTEITSRSVTVSESITGQTGGILILVNAPQNATGSNALFQTSPVTFSPLTGSTQAPTNLFIEPSPDFPTQSGTATSPTQWSNEAKPSTSWANETL